MDGVGTVKYEWYLSQNSDINSSYTKLGTTGTVCSSTANMGHNGRYFYCKVTSTIDGVSASATSNKARLVVQEANYSTVKSGTTTYYHDLNQAFNGATSGGGDTGGGTITVINSNTDTSDAINRKVIKLNMNKKTITRSNYIATNAGTLTIVGGGKINNNNGKGGNALLGKGGNLTISEDVRVDSEEHAITMTTGNLNIESGHFYAKGGNAIVYGGTEYKSGTVTIKNARIYAPKKNTSALTLYEGNYNVTITNTRVGNGSSDALSGLSSSKEAHAALSIATRGTVTLNGGTSIYGGKYGASPVGIWAPAIVKFLGSSCVYTANFKDSEAKGGRYCINAWVSGSQIEFNSTGRFFSGGNYVVHAETVNNVKHTIKKYTITKGDFAAQDSKYMFSSGGKPLTGYVGSLTTKNYYWMYSLTTLDKVQDVSCYYYRRGSW